MYRYIGGDAVLTAVGHRRFILYKFKLRSAWGMGAVLVVYSLGTSIYANGWPLGVRRRGSRSSRGRYWRRRYSAGRLGGWELTAVGHRVLLVQIKVNMGEGWWCTHELLQPSGE